MFLEIYIKIRATFYKFKTVISLSKFIYFLLKEKIFFNFKKENVVKLVQKYIELQYMEFGDSTKMSRDSRRSMLLLSSLSNLYSSSKSTVTLNQFLTVLKEEFIER